MNANMQSGRAKAWITANAKCVLKVASLTMGHRSSRRLKAVSECSWLAGSFPHFGLSFFVYETGVTVGVSGQFLRGNPVLKRFGCCPLLYIGQDS